MPKYNVEMTVAVDDKNPRVCGGGCDFKYHQVIGARCLRSCSIETLGNAEVHGLKTLRTQECKKEFGEEAGDAE